ncbi:hypothetical protein GCM10023085_39810 [Actinomadura viridis]|uniref:Membrane protein n=1 Tax=Actinomadura viridis TaxID=58110 RepID=A0A931GRD8_9ACTN|nr:hypothetical protein [Actinomadura viridis]MBG6092736.1 putative membrane protein [Actinomadura viridis]
MEDLSTVLGAETVALVAVTLGFRLAGAQGARRFRDWALCAAYGMAAMLVLTASAHFVPESVTTMPNHADLTRMVPSFVPFPGAMVYLTGVLELLGAAGLVLAGTRRAAGYCLAALFVVMLPANIHAAVADVPLAGDPPTPLWVRIPQQVVYIAIALWAARSATASPRPQEALSR